MQQKRIFITGILGFIGFHTATALQKEGKNVTGIDNCNDYYDRRWKFLRFLELKKAGITVQIIDIAQLEHLKNAIDEFNPDQIIHLAAQAGVRYSLENPSSYINSNCIGFYNLLECIKIKKTALIYASSSSVYGLNKKIPFSENDITDHPMSLYAATKKSNELFAHSYHLNYQIPMIGLRFFTVFGPFGRPDMAYFFFTEKILEEKPITLFNNGALKRDFTFIDDIILGIKGAMQFPVNYGIFNLGNHHPRSVKELVNHIESRVGKKAIVENLKAPSSEVDITFADISKSQALLNYHPQTQFEKGLDLFIDWYLGIKDHLPHLETMKKLHPEFFLSNLRP